MDAASKTSSEEREALLALFTALLRPLMPVALERGISVREISDSVRRAYVQVLEGRMAGQDRQLSDARLALVAGLTRSEVQLFRDPRRKTAAPAGNAVLQIAKLLTVWHTHPRFSGAYGLALDLDLVAATDPSRRSLDELVETAVPGADRDILLDELIATNSAEIVGHDTLRCRARAAIRLSSDDANVTPVIDRAAKCLEAAASSFAHNLLRENSGKTFFERMVISNHALSERSRDEFSAIAQNRGDSYVTELDSWIAKHTEPDESGAGRRYGVGVYFFEESQSLEQSDGARGLGGSLSAEGRTGSIKEIDVLAPPASMMRDQGKSGNLK
ncbi:MAG TPA: DUF6502 family protein [Steroidobacteraceae bacterium]